MNKPVSTIRNLGPATEKLFTRVNIHSAAQLQELGADQAYARLLANGTRPHFIGYYALVMGLQGRPWNDCQGREKADLRKKFDALKENTAKNDKGRANLDAALDAIGVIRRP